MPERERIERAVYRAVDELNRQLPGGVQIEKSPDAPLYGRAGKLESLDFVTFIMEVESRIKDEFGIDLVLSDENLLSRESSPFSTLGNLIWHLETVLEGE
jgi:acyl carrier protein